MRRAGPVILLAFLCCSSGAARAAWQVDSNGRCVQAWQSSDLLRGPTAIVNAPLLPFRTFAGGAQYAWSQEEWFPYQIAILGPAVTLFAGCFGVVESCWWVGTGLADTLSGGYFALAPEPATRLSIAPDIPIVLSDQAAPATDRCGRPLAASPPAAAAAPTPAAEAPIR
jgi:hypothetical protein